MYGKRGKKGKVECFKQISEEYAKYPSKCLLCQGWNVQKDLIIRYFYGWMSTDIVLVKLQYIHFQWPHPIFKLTSIPKLPFWEQKRSK